MKRPRKLSPKHSSAMRRAAGREPPRVQTPEGEKKFGQKIGEIIRRDGMKPRDDPATKPDVAAKAKSVKVKPVTTRKGSAHVADVATKAVAVKSPAKGKPRSRRSWRRSGVAGRTRAVGRPTMCRSRGTCGRVCLRRGVTYHQGSRPSRRRSRLLRMSLIRACRRRWCRSPSSRRTTR